MQRKRLIHCLKLLMIPSLKRKMEYIRNHSIFSFFGENSYYCPILLPIYPELVRIHDNVFIHKTAKIVPHDMINRFLNVAEPDADFGHIERLGCIELMDNVYVSMNSIILPNVRINRNCIITAGSVVVNDVPENSIVAGNPARVIGKFDQYLEMRKMGKLGNVSFENQHLPIELAQEKWKDFDKNHNDQIWENEGVDSQQETVTQEEKKIERQIADMLSEQISGVDLFAENHLIDKHIIDSLGMMTVVSSLEEMFKCKIPFNCLTTNNFNSVANMAKMILGINSINQPVEGNVSNALTDSLDLSPLNSQISDTDKSVVQRIMEFSLKNPNAPAVIANDKITSYIELSSMIYSIHNWINSICDNSEGRVVVVQAVHEDICVASYYAVHLCGAKLIPVEQTATSERILEIARETNAAMIIGINKCHSDIPWYDYLAVKRIAWNDVFSDKETVVYPDIDSPCEMVFTTGTTGKSKGVLMTHRHISWYSYSVAKSIEMKKNNRFLITTPLNHAGGLRRTHLSLANGCCIVYLNGLSDVGKYFDYIKRYHVSSLYLPPLAIRILLTRAGDELGKYCKQIDFVYSSSSSLPSSDCQKLRKLLPNTRLYNAYEASETPGVSAYDYNVSESRKNCLGSANLGVEIAILHENGSISKEPNSQGQICVKSMMNMACYYNEPELTKSVMNEDWFVSNDLGYLDEIGRVYYCGRKGDVINIGGYKIAPTDVENVAIASGLINECICFEDFDEYKIPYLKLAVVVSDGSIFNQNDLTAYISSKLEAYKVPRKIEIVNEIKKTFNGKIDRKMYRNNLAS